MERQIFLNEYMCPICEHEFDVESEGAPDAECPRCGTDVEPYLSEPIEMEYYRIA